MTRKSQRLVIYASWDKLVKILEDQESTRAEVLWVGVVGDGGQVCGDQILAGVTDCK